MAFVSRRSRFAPDVVGVAGRGANRAGRKDAVRLPIVLQGQTNLHQIVGTGNSPGGLACRLHGRQQQRDENPDDCDDDQQFHQRKPASRSHAPRGNALGGRSASVTNGATPGNAERCIRCVPTRSVGTRCFGTTGGLWIAAHHIAPRPPPESVAEGARPVKRPIVVRPSRLHCAGAACTTTREAGLPIKAAAL